jgi:hypothetical protein
MIKNTLAQDLINTPVPYPSKKWSEYQNIEWLKGFDLSNKRFVFVSGYDTSIQTGGNIPSEIREFYCLLIVGVIVFGE